MKLIHILNFHGKISSLKSSTIQCVYVASFPVPGACAVLRSGNETISLVPTCADEWLPTLFICIQQLKLTTQALNCTQICYGLVRCQPRIPATATVVQKQLFERQHLQCQYDAWIQTTLCKKKGKSALGQALPSKSLNGNFQARKSHCLANEPVQWLGYLCSISLGAFPHPSFPSTPTNAPQNAYTYHEAVAGNIDSGAVGE